MRIAVVGKHKLENAKIERKLKREGFVLDRLNPELIVCHGGDGTLLYNERESPGIPKVLLRGKHICRTCHDLTPDEMLTRLKRGQYRISEYSKLEARINGKTLTCSNDFVVRNKHPSRALRFTISIDGKKSGLIIGDGVVISTSFGSTAYFSSIARRKFESGIGIAFNNTVEVMDHLVVPSTSIIKVTSVRESADLSCDNMPKTFTLKSGESIAVRASKEMTRIVDFKR